jgi:hypothetical protein
MGGVVVGVGGGALFGGLNSTSAYGHIESEALTVDDVRNQVVAMSKEQRGCRLLQQAIERGASDILEQILAEVRQHLVFLMVDPFGNYLFQKLVEHTDPASWQSKILVSNAMDEMKQHTHTHTHTMSGGQQVNIARRPRGAACLLHG